MFLLFHYVIRYLRLIALFKNPEYMKPFSFSFTHVISGTFHVLIIAS